jgi:hypothetical protein
VVRYVASVRVFDTVLNSIEADDEDEFGVGEEANKADGLRQRTAELEAVRAMTRSMTRAPARAPR